MLEKNDKIGDYTLVKFLGQGQFGEVWLAEKQIQFSSRKFRHALKFISNHGEEIDIKTAEAEIDTWAEASGHPNIMPVLDLLVYKEYLIIVSEYADGGSLKNWLDNNGGKSPSIEKSLEMMVGILRGIEHLHSRKIIHRDLKPDNILLQGSFPRITDFGVSRIISENNTATKAIGSPAFMSPEAFLGNKSPQTDIWSAGVILYVLLKGDYPFDGKTIYDLKDVIQNNNPKPLPNNTPENVSLIITRALQKEAVKRFQTAREMRVAIEKVLYKLRSVITHEIIQENPKQFSTSDTIVDFSTSLNQSDVNEELLEEPSKIETGLPAITNLAITAPSQIEKTRDSMEIERERFEKQQKELLEINQNEEKTRLKNSIRQKKKLFWVAGGFGVIGSIIVLALMAYVIVPMFLNSPNNVPTTVKPIDESIANKDSINAGNTPITTPKISNKEVVFVGMVYISGGEFTMGTDNGKSEAEKPAHKVSVKPFYMSIYETTNKQYAEFVKATNHKSPTEWKNGTYPKGQENFPVVGVNWEDANAFAEWSKKRLPTEEEWEFAARGFNNFSYPWGNEWKSNSANVESKSFVEIGKYKETSPFGIYDMTGNAWEWTASEFKAYPNGKLPDTFAGKRNLKTIRGGSYQSTREFATTSYRIGWLATGSDSYCCTGIRLVKDIE
jgi:serine/threonine protein kinase